ncbi:MAG: type I 3-dehydroquinate dehydratase [Candidatus Thermoplasmatota archaeon]|jgi:3-dehydroquinate dehydratase-1|nr:type I 3-dehydroquinate dehydratase [Candidatus Thermoplasmatota archaeon]
MPIIEANPVNIGGTAIGGRKTTIVTSIFSGDSDSLLSRFRDGTYDPGFVYEVRYDLFRERDSGDLGKLVSGLKDLSVDFIFTYRFSAGQEGRLMYETAIALDVPALDIEVGVMPGIDLSAYGGTVIISTHDFKGGRVSHMLSGMMRLGGNIYKFASSYSDPHGFLLDLSDLYTFKRDSRVPVSLVPMGDGNSALRLFSGYMISDIVYASAEAGTAPGQLSRKDYKEFFGKF